MALLPSSISGEKRIEVGHHLRNADKFIREGNLAEAETELKKVRALDPQNPYAMAFNERIAGLKAEQAKPAAPPQPAQPEPEQKRPAEKTSVAPEAKTNSPAQKQQTDNHPMPPSAPASPSNSLKPVSGEEKAKPIAANTAVRTDIEQKVEDDYKIRFAAEIQKAEQRVAEHLHAEEEKLASERANMMEQFQKERTKFRDQMEQDFSRKLREELQKRENQLREQFDKEKARLEEDVRSNLRAEFETRIHEMQQSTECERNTLAQREVESITKMKKELEADYAARLASELDKLKQSTHVKEEKSRIDLESATRNQLQQEYETQLAHERAEIETRYKKLQQQLEASYKQQQQQALDENRQMLEQQLKDVRQKGELTYEQQRIAYKKQIEQEFETKSQALLADERRKQDERLQQALAQAREEFESERARLLDHEQKDLENLRKNLKDQMDKDMAAEIDKASRDMERAYEHKMTLLGVEIPKTKEQRVKLYQTRVREAWADGPLTMEKAQQLMELQDILGLEFDEHNKCEAEIRLQLYAENVQKAILGGSLKPSNVAALEELKARYDISPDESANVEPIILSAFQRAAVKAVIMIIDDDTALLDIIDQHLRSLGYSVLSFATLAEAAIAIEKSSVDLILCDIQFKGEKGDGFTFFKSIQQKPHLRKTPFVLMSSLDEGLFIRTGVQLGVDDYLTKPLDLDLLTAVIEGKLKKYKTMND